MMGSGPSEVASWLPSMRQTVERWFASNDYDTTRAFPLMMMILRDHDLVAFLSAPTPDVLAEFAGLAVSGFEADELVVLADVLSTRSLVNPEGQRWGVGEMALRAHEPAVRALLVDQIVAYQVLRDGPASVVCAPYRCENRRLAWEEPTPAAVHMDARLRPLHSAVKAPWLSEREAGLIGSFPPEEQGHVRLLQHLATVRALCDLARATGVAVDVGLIASADPAVRGIVDESLRRSGLADKVTVVDDLGNDGFFHAN